MSDLSWYEVIQGPEILQGDLLLSCPVVRLSKSLTWPVTADSVVPGHIQKLDVIVTTQSCDLASAKVEEVLLARVTAWGDIVREEVQSGNSVVKSSKFRKKLIDGDVPSLSLLHRHETNPRLEWSVVDFHWLYTLPLKFVQEFAFAAGPRLRLLSPYREHLAQAFARYFMRVGLPHDARAFEKEGDVQP